MTDPDNLRELIERATPGPWYTLDPPWLPRDSETSILAGSPDPHVATFVADMDMWALDDDDDRKSKSPDADAALIVAAVNALPALLDHLDAQAAEIERLRESLRIGERFLDKCTSAWSCGEPPHRVKDMLDAADEFRIALQEQKK